MDYLVQEGITLKLALSSDSSNPEEDVYEIVGTGTELQKERITVNDEEVTYYSLTMPAANVTIGKKTA